MVVQFLPCHSDAVHIIKYIYPLAQEANTFLYL